MKFLSIVLSLLLLAGCVGKVEDANLEKARNAESGRQTFQFAGISKVIPISNDKIEVYFFPATGPASELTYLIKVNDATIPIEVKADSLSVNDEGMYRFTVRNLNVNTEYTFSVGVRDGSTGSQSENDATLSAKTFSNFTADFAGISSVEPLVGAAGQNTVLVKWVPAVTLGSTYNPMPNDPIAYEVSYIAADDGTISDLFNNTHPAIQRDLKPGEVTASTGGTTERERQVTGLMPGKQYYFRVRSIHKSYGIYQDTQGYRFEENNKIISVTTLGSGGLFDWDTLSLRATTPDKNLGLTSIDLTWAPAVGPFENYRIYNYKLGEAEEDVDLVRARIPEEIDASIIDPLNLAGDYRTANAEEFSKRIGSLEEYDYYLTFAIACRTLTCGDGERIIGKPVFYRAIPKLASFSGILGIQSPQDINNLNQITINFDPPVIETGFLNGFDIYCYEGEGDASPTLLNFNVANASGKASCDGLIRLDDNPGDYAGFGAYTSVRIQGNFFGAGDTVADKEYCFAAVPSVTGNNFSLNDVDNAIVKCITPIVKVPTVEQFPGVINACNTGADYITVSWDAPTGGIYDKYAVFYKEKDGKVFKYTDALANDPAYTRVDNIVATTYTYTIPSLVPGKIYQFGVLPYIDGASPIYADINTGLGECKIEVPKPRFEEWVDIFAIGPKANGMVTPTGPDRKKDYILETLNDSGQPIEVEVDPATLAPTSGFEDQFGIANGSTQFSGAYGSKDGVTTNSLHQYSNSGIIRIAWKDVTFTSGTLSMQTFIDAYETGLQKKDHKIGYRVYRSDDNKITWKDITSGDFDYQTLTNKGLLHPVDYTERSRTNEVLETYRAVMFTDYSVKHIQAGDDFNHARVYYYKVVPVFRGVELEYERETTNPQHIIKVVLPPENMALVHRFMANRQQCRELGKVHSRDISQKYTCSWNGVGARGLTSPWIKGSTVYDFGPSMLIDRFELGCNFTRGDYAYERSNFSGTIPNFTGSNDLGSGFVGCFNGNSPGYTSGVNHPNTGESYTDRSQLRVGDCFGEDTASIAITSTTCSDPDTADRRDFVAPGISGDFTDCTDPANIATNFFNPYGGNGSYASYNVQSEFAAVYYSRNAVKTYEDRISHGYYRGAGGAALADGNNLRNKNFLGPSRCMINIPVSDSTDGDKLKPRWLAVNNLSTLAHGVDDVDILDMSMNDILTNNKLFDSGINATPSPAYTNVDTSPRYRGNTKLSRVFSSNDSKLPPLTGLSQTQANRVCNSYEVKIGTYDDDAEEFKQIGPVREKRLMRRGEGITASRYPKDFDEAAVAEVETGTRNDAPVTSGVNFQNSCNVYDRDVISGAATNQQRSGDRLMINMPSSYQGTVTTPRRVPFITGSSFYDNGGTQFTTQACTSRFGVQDIIGNKAEISSEQIFCGFDSEKLMLGAGLASNSVEAPNGAFYLNTLISWVMSDTDTGRCSFVEPGGARGGNYLVNGAFTPIFDLFGNVNTGVAESVNSLDPGSVSYYRNGDGFFLDFGQDNFAPKLSINDTLAIKWDQDVINRAQDISTDPRRGRYFNPILGLPLECQGSLCSESLDNMSISLETFVTDFSLDPSSMDIPNFPVGDSQIFSDGMSEITVNRNRYISPASREYFYDFIESVDPAMDTYATYSSTHGGALKSSLDNDGTAVDYVRWSLSRTTPIYMLNFGESNTKSSGRYSAKFNARNEYDQMRSEYAAVRCVVRIEDESYQ
ncbi:fibronectin type III domain-containing protein [Halobacteriovorax sp. XZX-3]|uniref:fibronectin type III domain-containing protein n=1 Tax=unclassified Halobacteriovorax TaxID=2639665 RepID=UPI003716D48B